MRDYSIKFGGINDLKNSFFYSLNSKKNKRVIIRVYNSYLNYREYEERLELSPGFNFWTYIPSNNKNRYVEFRDEETLEIVGLFGLDGVIDIEDFDNFKYVKTIFNDLKPGEKHNVYVVFNEITSQRTYNNDFICVEKDDLVVDIGFNYGLFSMTSLRYQPGRIIAFEPNPKLVKTFKGYFKESMIELHQKAVSNKNGYATFYENLDPGMSTIFDDINNVSQGDSYEVEVINFNDFIISNNIEKIDYLKVDCEGAEYDIFGSMSDDYLKNNIMKVAIEFHHKLSDIKVQDLIGRLKRNDFNIELVYEENSNIGLIYGKK
jgi:FkbM family methyltransferase